LACACRKTSTALICKNNITAFWQSWHITLSSWARFYVFTPLSRPAAAQTAAVAHPHRLRRPTATMITIGLWHGITWNFLIWGLVARRGAVRPQQWSDRTRPWYRALAEKPAQKRAWTLVGWFVTFHFVVPGLGLVFAADVETAVAVFGRAIRDRWW
jgi:alginate O-acetyltransferase complex protein AlgI